LDTIIVITFNILTFHLKLNSHFGWHWQWPHGAPQACSEACSASVHSSLSARLLPFPRFPLPIIYRPLNCQWAIISRSVDC